MIENFPILHEALDTIPNRHKYIHAHTHTHSHACMCSLMHVHTRERRRGKERKGQSRREWRRGERTSLIGKITMGSGYDQMWVNFLLGQTPSWRRSKGHEFQEEINTVRLISTCHGKGSFTLGTSLLKFTLWFANVLVSCYLLHLINDTNAKLYHVPLQGTPIELYQWAVAVDSDWLVLMLIPAVLYLYYYFSTNSQILLVCSHLPLE